MVACGISPITGLRSCYRTPRDSWELASFSFCSSEFRKNLGPGCEVSLGKPRVIEKGCVSARVCSAVLWHHPVHHVMPRLMGFIGFRARVLGMYPEETMFHSLRFLICHSVQSFWGDLNAYPSVCRRVMLLNSPLCILMAWTSRHPPDQCFQTAFITTH